MSAKKGRRAKMPAVPPEEKEKDPDFGNLDASNLSSIERASFLEQVQQNYGNPLHSTAMEEDLNPPEDEKIHKGGRGVTKGAPHKGRTAAAKQRGASVQKKKKGSDGENKMRKERTNIGGKVKARSGKEGGKKRKKEAIEEEIQESDGEEEEEEEEEEESDQGPAPKKSNQPVASSRGATANGIKRPAKKRRSLGQKPAERPVKNGGMKMEKRRKKSGSREPGDLQSQESDSDAAQQHRRPVLSSEEATDEDLDRTPSQKRGRARARARKSSSDRAANRKSSSASGSPEPKETIRERRRKEGRGQQGATELEVVLDAFLDFCDQYRESVESKAIKRAIDSLSSSVKDQLTKQITESKELKVLIRDKAKVDSLIRKKRQRLLDAKYELIRAEQQVRSLQKVEVGLEQRLTDLRRSQAFLRDIRDLNRQYLKHRHTHPKEKEKYGASSLPALLLETKYILGAEHQLRGINNQIEKRLKEAGK
ncbi:centromere protein U isoform X2 [Myripristis murdjan]|uniref:centromere protein U isoform X2 n=1 Tax=Myripristis murdjan TaxID=586833 RepID=UPI001176213D|nr:centromere protein U-like isoform X2 [Myripristis murdjan]